MVRIREATPDDADELSQIALAAKSHWNYPESWLQLWEEQLRVSRNDLSVNAAWLIEQRGTTVAFAIVSEAHGRAELEHLWVRPAHLGLGLGRRLMEQIFTHCRESGIDTLRVVSDPNAEGFYRHLGARQIGLEPSVPAPRQLPVLLFSLVV